MTRKHLIEETGKAVEILYNLNIRLSNGYTGIKESPWDQSLTKLRNHIFKALEELNTSELLEAGKDYLLEN